jgi:isoleucyl-tRNA synthetase
VEARGSTHERGKIIDRPFVDGVTWGCPECGKGTMRRVPELIDVWFDSGAMPVAQWGYPYHNQDMFKDQFPADYICEAIDQTRGWFYSLHAISTLLFKSVSYKNVLCLGHILDENGQKASKSRGNVVDPWDVLNLYGADAFRWYMFTASPPGDSRRFSVGLVGQVYHGFWSTLWNTYSFFVTYANLDGFDPSKTKVAVKNRSPLDRWILAELHALVKEVTQAFDHYDVTGSTRPIERFVVDNLSNWYVRRSRPRFWKSESDADKAAAQSTLYECLVTVAKLLAPTMPFMADELYRNLVSSVDASAPDSVHLASWPEYDASLIDQTLIDEMQLVMRLVRLGHAARNSAQVKVRQPLAGVSYALPPDRASVVRAYAPILADELNVKSVGVLDQPGELVTYSLNPLPKPLGERFKGDFPAIQKTLRQGDQRENALALLAGKPITVSYDGKQAELTGAEVEVKVHPVEGYAVAQEMQVLAALDVRLTDDLVAEGLAREFIRRVQTMRKDAGFEVSDRVATTYKASPKLAKAVEQFADLIKAETLTTDLKEAKKPTGSKVEEHTFDGETLAVGVRKA